MQKRQLVTICFDIGVVCCFFLVRKMTEFMLNNFDECLFSTNGILCPSCGGTRSLHSFVSGQFGQALRFNPFVFFCAVYLFIIILVLNLENLFGLKFAIAVRKQLINYHVVIGMAIVYAIFGLIRNFL